MGSGGSNFLAPHSPFPTPHSLLSLCSLSQNIPQVHATAALSREERFEQAGESRQVARLDQNLARPREFGDDALAAHEAAEPAGGRGFAQFVPHVSFPGYEVARVDYVPFSGIEPFAVNRAERRNQQQARSLDLQYEQPFATEERSRAAPARINRQAGVPRQIRTRLHEEDLAVQLDGRNVSRRSGRETDFPRPAARGEGRDESRLAADRALQRSHHPALHLRLQIDIA